MTKRTVTIRLSPDWKVDLWATARKAAAKTYQGEVLAFDTPAAFFGRLTERRWKLVGPLTSRIQASRGHRPSWKLPRFSPAGLWNSRGPEGREYFLAPSPELARLCRKCLQSPLH
ncbi:MAG: hypothetical protein AB7O44_32080 [Hyphomicrobiaceae bacterium]